MIRFKGIYPSIIFIVLVFIMIIAKISIYNYNLSSLINIWDGFNKINLNYVEKGFVVNNNGGYDGQFFYFNSKYIFTEPKLDFPKLDSFELRFSRIGLSIIIGLFCKVFSFKFYSEIALFVLIFFHLLSYFLIQKILSAENKIYAQFYLFSPFSIISILLLVSDSLFVSFLIILYILSEKELLQNQILNNISLFLCSVSLLFTKEIGIVFIMFFLSSALLKKQFSKSLIFFITIILYSFYRICVSKMKIEFVGTNPLSFFQLIDYPLFGLIKSFSYVENLGIKTFFREILKLLLFSMLISKVLMIKNLKKIEEYILFLPILFSIFLILFAEVGYWLNFDNIARLYTASLVWIIIMKVRIVNFNTYYYFHSLFILSILIILKLLFKTQVGSFYFN